MKRGEEGAGEEVNVLVTVAEDATSRLDEIAGELRTLGLKQAEVFRLGGVIAGAVPVADLARFRAVPGVASLEIDQTFTTGS
jgi:hypothetical protein